MFNVFQIETYSEYKKVKSLVTGGEDKKEKKVTFCEDASPSLALKEEEVFGKDLNKKPKTKAGDDGGRGKEREGSRERKSMWKVRRWSKDGGHHTVVVNGNGMSNEGENGGDTDKAVKESEVKDEEAKNKVDISLSLSLFPLSLTPKTSYNVHVHVYALY